MKAWVFQYAQHVKARGDKAAWYVGYYDPEGKRKSQSCGTGKAGKRNATRLRDKIAGELITRTYKDNTKKTWTEFRQEFEQKIASGMKPQTRRLALEALDHFQRIIKPVRIGVIKTQTIDDYIAARRKEPGKKHGETIRPATVNKDLRHIKAALRIAHEWKYLAEVPKFRMVKEPGKLIRIVTAEHFAAMYAACGIATRPAGIPSLDPADWWRGLLCFAYMTGWRIGEILCLARDDVDMQEGFAITRSEDNKGGRDERVKLHLAVAEHLEKLAAFDRRMLPWNHDESSLYAQYHAIQKEAGIKLQCGRQHTHTDACHYYGFHDLRRAFATLNAPRLTGDALQKLMRHKAYATTQRYINMASQIDEAVAKLHVPDVLRGAGQTG